MPVASMLCAHGLLDSRHLCPLLLSPTSSPPQGGVKWLRSSASGTSCSAEGAACLAALHSRPWYLLLHLCPLAVHASILQAVAYAMSHAQAMCAAGGPIGEITDMGDTKLLKTVERWLRRERKAVTDGSSLVGLSNGHQEAVASDTTSTHNQAAKQPAPFFPSRHMAYFH